MSSLEWSRNDLSYLDPSPIETLGQSIAVELDQAAEVLYRDNDIISSDPLDGISRSGVYPVSNSDSPHLLYGLAVGALTKEEFAAEQSANVVVNRKQNANRTAAKVVELVSLAA